MMRIAKIAGVAVDARVVARNADPARATRWIAANLLAACAGEHPTEFDRMLAVATSAPAPLDAASLPWSWRTFLRVVGMPLA
jgi:hypothetical protein